MKGELTLVMFIKINVPERMLDQDIRVISSDDKFINPLKRSGIHTIDKLIDIINNDELKKMRGVGKERVNLIKNKLLNYIIENMTQDEVDKFIRNFVGM